MTLPGDLFEQLLLALLVAAIGWFSQTLFKKVLMPAYQETFLDTTKLEPTYTGTLTFGPGDDNEIQLRPKKRGWQVTGTFEFISGRHKGKSYNVAGKFSNELLSLIYTSNDRGKPSRGSATLALRQGGASLEGYIAYRDLASHSVQSARCDLVA